jgi:hypothetical protein
MESVTNSLINKIKVYLKRYVASKLGGTVARNDVANLGYELPINELKFEHKSNIVLIGKIKIGTYYHRALLFKVCFLVEYRAKVYLFIFFCVFVCFRFLLIV